MQLFCKYVEYLLPVSIKIVNTQILTRTFFIHLYVLICIYMCNNCKFMALSQKQSIQRSYFTGLGYHDACTILLLFLFFKYLHFQSKPLMNL